MNWISIANYFQSKIFDNRSLMVLAILIIVAASVVVYLLDINWREQVEKWGFFGVFLLMLIGSITILFPLPFEAILAAAPGIMGLTGGEVFWLGLVASIGGSLGEVTAYLAGLWGKIAITGKHEKGYGRVERGMSRYGGAAIFVFALTPLPFDLVGIAAGTVQFRLWKFLIFCWAGRFLRSLLIVYLGWAGWGSIEHFFLSGG